MFKEASNENCRTDKLFKVFKLKEDLGAEFFISSGLSEKTYEQL